MGSTPCTQVGCFLCCLINQRHSIPLTTTFSWIASNQTFDLSDNNSLSWFCSYLKHRLQCIVIGGVTLDPFNLKFGVPQGSLLGPILFTIYISLISKIVRKYNVEIHIYAENTQLYIYFKFLVMCAPWSRGEYMLKL